MGWLSRVKLSPALVLALAAVVLALRGVAAGSVPGHDGVITACIGKHGGGLRVVDTAKRGRAGRCSRRERKLTWNQTGPQGIQGLAGTSGPAGSPGGATKAVIRFVGFTSDGGGQSG